jgi:hypothetical protein
MVLELVEAGGFITHVIVGRGQFHDLVDQESTLESEKTLFVFLLLALLLLLLVRVVLSHHFFLLQVLLVLLDLFFH